jgi:spore coat protein CotH
MGEGVDSDISLSEQPMTGRQGGMAGGETILLERFKANETFMALYEQKLQEIYQALFLSGALTDKAQEYSALMHTVNEARGVVDMEAYEAAVEKVMMFLEERGAYVESLGLMEK